MEIREICPLGMKSLPNDILVESLAESTNLQRTRTRGLQGHLVCPHRDYDRLNFILLLVLDIEIDGNKHSDPRHSLQLFMGTGTILAYDNLEEVESRNDRGKEATFHHGTARREAA